MNTIAWILATWPLAALALGLLIGRWFHHSSRPMPPSETDIDLAVSECIDEMWRQINADLRRRP